MFEVAANDKKEGAPRVLASINNLINGSLDNQTVFKRKQLGVDLAREDQTEQYVTFKNKEITYRD